MKWLLAPLRRQEMSLLCGGLWCHSLPAAPFSQRENFRPNYERINSLGTPLCVELSVNEKKLNVGSMKQ